MKKYFIFLLTLSIGFFSFKAADDYFEVAKNLDIFASVYKEVNTGYVDDVKPGELIRVAIDAMLNSLDPYTNFYSEAQAEDYLFQVTGTYAGIGTSVLYIDNRVIIDAPHDGYPAQKAGMLPGDVIIGIDGKDMRGKTTKEVIDQMHGKAGSSVIIEVDRPGIGKKSFTLVREQIKVPNVPYSGLLENNTGYVKLTGFTPGAGNEVRQAVNNLRSNGADKIILDLRGNGGGLLNEAINVVNVFVKKGTVVVTTKGKYRENDRLYATLSSPLDTEIPLVVLIDDHSASASEIVSGALQDLDRGLIVGRNSFGKGLVQGTRSLSYNTQMKITIAKYYLPSGRLIQRLDYGNKINGKAVAVADSLKLTFRTLNGRPVTDGEGIFPDIEVKQAELSKLTQALVRNRLIFDYASLYRNKTESIASAKEFDIDESLYSEFRDFLSGKDYSYTTKSEDILSELKKQAEEDQLGNELIDQLQELEAELIIQKTKDLIRYQQEIKELLEYEIARRYYFDNGIIEIGFDDDLDIAKAMEVLSDLTKLSSLLGN